jgi:hypothetical protein
MQAKFDPATFLFPDTGQPLQCAAAKTSTCLSQAQINAVKIIHQGGKIIWFHGASDPIPPVDGTIAYFDALTAKNGGAAETEKFAQLTSFRIWATVVADREPINLTC